MSRIRWIVSSAAFALHLAVANRYDFFRDELYFIACGRHPAFGYADQPPVIPLLAAGSQLFGEHLWILRAISALGAFGVVWFTCKLSELLGSGAWLAGIAAATAPMLMGVTLTLGTSSFQPAAWAAIVYFVARAVVAGDSRAWIWAGIVAGVDLEIKYDLPIFVIPLFIPLIRRLDKNVLIAALLAAVLALPSAIWQFAHGLPFRELMHAAAAGKNKVVPAGEFLLGQLLVMNPIYALLALAGVAAPWIGERFRKWRFLSISFALTLAAMLALHAKDYYFSPAYGPLFALGGAAIDRWIAKPWLKLAPLVPALAFSAIAAPMALPILDPPRLAEYMSFLHQAPESGENLEQSDIPQEFADMLGWRALTQEVARVVRSLPPDEQKRVVILGRNYGQSAAIDFFGPAYGLPHALGRHNQYWYWGPGDSDGKPLLLLNWRPEKVKDRCAEAIQLGTVDVPHILPHENHLPITLCRGLKQPLSQLWPELKLII